MTRPLVLGTLVVALSLACRERTAPEAAATALSPGGGASDGAGPPSIPPDGEPPGAAAVPAVAPEGAGEVRSVPVAQAPAPDAGRLAAPGPATAAATLLREAVALDPTGPIALSREDETVVDPAATFRLVLAAELPEARLVLLDAADAIVASSGTREVGATTTFTLTPSVPLVPGSHYLLRLDGARTREIHDVSGRAFSPMNLGVLVAGEPPKPEPKPKPAPRKRRGRR